MNPLKRHWLLDPDVTFLNHGSFGACPRVVLEHQQSLREQLERQPVEFFVRRYEGLLDEARAELAAFLGADPEGLVPVSNATTGVNTVLRSLELARDDELLVTDHAYNACRNALDYACERAGARVISVVIPFELTDPGEVIERVLAATGPRTRLALLDHVTSQTGMVLPLPELIDALGEREIDALVDGAHAPGMLPLSLDELGAAYYTGNCHKWICAPKGAGFLHIRPDRRDRVRPLTISHGANTPRPGRSRLHDEFDWMGTADPTAFLCVPAALRAVAGMVPGGWPEVRQRNNALCVEARDRLIEALEIAAPCPESMIGSLASLPLPDGSPEPPESPLYADPLQQSLLDACGIEVPIIPWPAPPRRLIRISAQIYNEPEEYERLAAALPELL